MISLIVGGCEQPEQSREEIARLLKEYGVGAVCLLASGMVAEVERVVLHLTGQFSVHYDLGDAFEAFHGEEGNYGPWESKHQIIRVYPPGTRLRVTVEVVK